MEISWTPSSSRIIGGARVEDGVLTATHIGAFLGTEPSARRVGTSVRMTTAVTGDQQLEMLTLWGSRDLLANSWSGRTELARRGGLPAFPVRPRARRARPPRA